ncbi:MlaD family protein [Elioraea rosea]|uniref:MlaD family protein n=1 Tax=Elioraea rosea TaxID=2492390 RepID=UPI001184FE84|nr:MlaD family protein [Elioraea rosea]
MESKTIYFRVGVVILSGLAMLAALIVWVGSDAFRSAGRPFETYFAESVQGLEVGSPVRFRGVPIGRVTQISMAAAEYGQDVSQISVLSNPAYRFVVVRFEVFTDRIAAREIAEVRQMVQGGLRMRMASQGITGVLYLEADFVDPIRFAALPVPWESRYPYIPAVPSTLAQFQSAAERVMARLEAADLPKLVEQANTLVEALATSVTSGDAYRMLVEAGDLLAQLRTSASTLSPEANGVLADLRTTLESLRTILESREMRATTSGLAATTQRLPQTAAAIEQAARRLDGTVTDADRDLAPLLRDLRATAENLRTITENMRQFPSQFLFGAPPPRNGPVPAQGGGQ